MLIIHLRFNYISFKMISCHDVTQFNSTSVGRYLRSGAAFNSHHMLTASENLKAALESSASKFNCQRTKFHLFSTVNGTCVSGRKLDPQYWRENLQERVEFWSAAIAAMETHLAPQKQGHLLIVSLNGMKK